MGDGAGWEKAKRRRLMAQGLWGVQCELAGSTGTFACVRTAAGLERCVCVAGPRGSRAGSVTQWPHSCF